MLVGSYGRRGAHLVMSSQIRRADRMMSDESVLETLAKPAPHLMRGAQRSSETIVLKQGDGIMIRFEPNRIMI
jgi:hypothetical protein